MEADQRQKLERARRNIEQWFDHEMERVSGWYKRNAQKWALAFAVLLVALMNADTITLGRHLWHDPKLRDAIVTVTQAEIQARASPSPAPSPTPSGGSAPAASPTSPIAVDVANLMRELKVQGVDSLLLGWAGWAWPWDWDWATVPTQTRRPGAHGPRRVVGGAVLVRRHGGAGELEDEREGAGVVHPARRDLSATSPRSSPSACGRRRPAFSPRPCPG